jgi:hypothetical protein
MMSGRIMFASLALVVVVGMCVGTRGELLAQAPAGARTDGDAAVAALVAEVRALRTELAAASRNQLRAQMLMGRVGLQEQRLAYLDKQRTDTASQVALQAQLTAGLRAQVQAFESGGCNAMPVEARRDCQANAATLKQQLAQQDAREQQLRSQESELVNALAAEQARWSEFNTRLDELERATR